MKPKVGDTATFFPGVGDLVAVVVGVGGLHGHQFVIGCYREVHADHEEGEVDDKIAPEDKRFLGAAVDSCGAILPFLVAYLTVFL